MQVAAMATAVGLALAGGPHYDVPRGYTRCSDAVAWHGFFKWASEEGSSCQAAARFMKEYAAAAGDAPTMPRHVAGYSCRLHFWRNEDGDVYASRHVCSRRDVTVRFYGMV
jgi:hypothetical protein